MDYEYDSDEYWDNYESGPFCRHWGECDCEVVCARCGHKHYEHDLFDGDLEPCNSCDCPGFVDPAGETIADDEHGWAWWNEHHPKHGGK